MPALQDGVYHAPTKAPGRFFGLMFLRAGEGETMSSCAECLTELWAMWQDLRAGKLRDLPGETVPHADLTVLLGLGPKLFKLEGANVATPEGLDATLLFRPPDPAGGGPLLKRENKLGYADDVRRNPAAEQVAVQFIANSQLAVNRAIVETWKFLHDRADAGTGAAELALATFYLGFQREDHRSWIDFHDGISNLRSEDREKTISIAAGESGSDEWLVGGTYLAFLRLEVDLRTWRRLDRATQELIVGRDKLSGCPLTSVDGKIMAVPGCPMGGEAIWATANDPFAEPPKEAREDPRLKLSHVQRANQHVRGTDEGSLRIFRQGYEFMEYKDSAPGFRVGLNFVSFQDTTRRLIRVLSQPGWLGDVNFGGDAADQPPGMDRFLKVYASGVFVVPPKRDGERFPGADALTGSLVG